MTSYTGDLSATIAVKIDKELKDALANKAEELHLSLSAVARLAIQNGLASLENEAQVLALETGP